MLFRLALALIPVIAINADDDSKWSWTKSSRNRNEDDEVDRRGGSSSFLNRKSPRYEVFEGDGYRPDGGNFGSRPDFGRPPPNIGGNFGGPGPGSLGIRPGSSFVNGQIDNRPPLGPIVPDGDRPGGVYGPEGNNFIGNYGQGFGGSASGILTGPVPSWVREPPFKRFDSCKCTEKFNCPGPGVSYGHCDAGKSYCCFTKSGYLGGPVPSRPIHSPENGILVGPGGPFDGPNGPGPAFLGRPDYNLQRPPYGRPVAPGFRPDHEDGLLVGPGAPPNRPLPGQFPGRPGGFGVSNGVLAGPNGGFDGPSPLRPPGGGFGANLPNGGFGLNRIGRNKKITSTN